MTISISPMLERILTERATQWQVSVDDLVNQALSSYLQSDPDLEAELEVWREVGNEAVRLVEESTP